MPANDDGDTSWWQAEAVRGTLVRRKTINRIENGCHSPSPDRVFVLAAVLGVEPLELFRWNRD
jgi:transcriptional regulator with XRE-family HTH domain